MKTKQKHQMSFGEKVLVKILEKSKINEIPHNEALRKANELRSGEISLNEQHIKLTFVK
ncbi:hypothetical protein KKH36_00720 [Patescibacteria group bacterium]|nr:hypothetical protein [Patescibacteria group bacterium]